MFVMRNRSRLYVDPGAKAAECNHAIERVADPDRRIVLERLQSFWIALSDALALGHEHNGADHFSIVSEIHAELIAGCRSAMH